MKWNEMKELLDHRNACKASYKSSVVCIVRWNTKLLPLWIAKMDCVWDKINNLWADEKNQQAKYNSNLVLM